jgi:hypothetical protein
MAMVVDGTWTVSMTTAWLSAGTASEIRGPTSHPWLTTRLVASLGCFRTHSGQASNELDASKPDSITIPKAGPLTSSDSSPYCRCSQCGLKFPK